MNPPFGKRKWIKLWTTEWLDGTTRYQMSGAQRAFWVDLLAMAGASRFPGVICAGRDGDSFVGYPISRFQGLVSDPIDVAATLDLFERTGKIRIVATSDGPPRAVKIEILNWSKYQDIAGSERAKRYREKQKKQRHPDRHVTGHADHHAATNEHHHGVEVEGEVDRDEDEEEAADASIVENENTSTAASENLTAAAAFSAIGFDKPVGDNKFQTILIAKYQERACAIETRTDFLEAVLQECQANRIGVPPQVYAMKRRIEEEDRADGSDARLRGGRN